MKQFGILIGALSALALVTGCSRAPDQVVPPAVPVLVAQAKLKDVPVQLQAIGAVRAYSTVQIKSRVNGQLGPLGFQQGEEVKKDQLILTIDPRPFQAALSQAEGYLARDIATLRSVEADWERIQELANTKAIAATAVDQARAKVDGLKATVAADVAAVENAKLQLSFCSIRSPIQGRIGLVLVNEGNIVKDNETLLAVVNQTRPVYVDFSVPEEVLAEVRKQMAVGKLPVTVTRPGQNQGSVTGELAVVNNAVDTTTGTVLLRAVFANDDESLWPGQFANVSVTLSVQRGAVVVPANAVQVGQQGPYVYVIKPDQTVESRLVVTGEELGDETVVKEGVQPGETVVTSNHLRLNPGTKVQLKRAAEPVAKKSS